MKTLAKIRFEKQEGVGITVSNTFDLRKIDMPNDHDPFRPHRVSFYVLLYIHLGKGKHFIDFEEYEYRPGTLFLIRPDQVHAFDKNIHKSEVFLLLFRSDFEKKFDKTLHDLILSFRTGPPYIQIPPGGCERIHDLMFVIHEIQKDISNPNLGKILSNYLAILLYRIQPFREVTAHIQKTKYFQEFLSFQSFLRIHLPSERTVAFYAEKMRISTKKLNTITKECVQLTAKNYIISMLILELKRELVNTHNSIKEIAILYGFSEPTNFVKFFKKHTGEPPAKY